jgi:hypothetical protein
LKETFLIEHWDLYGMGFSAPEGVAEKLEAGKEERTAEENCATGVKEVSNVA